MTDPQIVCPNCSTSIKLTESLAAPLVAETKRRFERQLADREEQFGQREAKLRLAEQELAKSRETIDERVATQLKAERSRIAEAEAKRARLALLDSRPGFRFVRCDLEDRAHCASYSDRAGLQRDLGRGGAENRA